MFVCKETKYFAVNEHNTSSQELLIRLPDQLTIFAVRNQSWLS